MTTVAEAIAAAQTQMSAVLDAGVDQLSLYQEITFTKYVKLVLPLDGFVFWVRADLVGAAAMQNATQIGPNPVNAAPSFAAKGSIHLATNRRQEEEQTVAVNALVFTSEVEVQPLSEVSPVVMFLGTWEGVRFAFAQRSSFYRQANLHHYVGDAVYPAFATQIIDDVAQLDQRQVVSNSLPVWLSLAAVTGIALYPAFLVPDNLTPPYAVVSIPPGTTTALQAVPLRDIYSTHWQLVSDVVKVTFYGLRNDQVLDFQDSVNEFSMNTDIIGIMNMPVVRDERRMQAELTALSIVKSIEFKVSYYQTRINDIARQVITSCVPSVTLGA